MHSSMRISSPCAKAASTAAGSSSAVRTFVTPNDEPLALGFTKSGRPSPATMRAGSKASPRRRKRSRASGMPRPASVRLVVILSKVMTDEVIEHDE